MAHDCGDGQRLGQIHRGFGGPEGVRGHVHDRRGREGAGLIALAGRGRGRSSREIVRTFIESGTIGRRPGSKAPASDGLRRRPSIPVGCPEATLAGNAEKELSPRLITTCGRLPRENPDGPPGFRPGLLDDPSPYRVTTCSARAQHFAAETRPKTPEKCTLCMRFFTNHPESPTPPENSRHFASVALCSVLPYPNNFDHL